jgi:hypothetical protein
VHTETTGSIPDDDMKYDVHLWEVHTITMGITHTVDGKYIASTLGSSKSQRRVAKMFKRHSQINEVQQLILGSTHGDDEKYKYSVFGSAAFT